MVEAKNTAVQSGTRRSKPESLDRSEREANSIKETLIEGENNNDNNEGSQGKEKKKEGQVRSLQCIHTDNKIEFRALP